MMSWRRALRRAILAGSGALVATGAQAAPAAQASAPGIASATVIRPLRVQPITDMDFGTIVHEPGLTGTVMVSPGSAGASFTGGASCPGSDCTSAHTAHFAVSGEPQRNYAIQLPASILATGSTITAGAIAPSLTVRALTVRAKSSNTTPSLDASGADSFEVGGTITLPADLPPARYRASFVVVVSYT